MNAARLDVYQLIKSMVRVVYGSMAVRAKTIKVPLMCK